MPDQPRTALYPLLRQHATAVTGTAVLVSAIIVGTLAVEPTALPTATQALVLILCVVLAAATGLRRTGYATTVVVTAGFVYLLVPPYRSGHVEDPEDLQAILLTALIGIVITEVASWARRQQQTADREADQMAALLRAHGEFLATDSAPPWLVVDVTERIKGLLDAAEIRIDPDWSRGHRRDALVLQPDGTVLRDGAEIDVDAEGLPIDDHLAIPVGTTGFGQAAVLVTAAGHVARPSRRNRQLAVALANHMVLDTR